MTQLIAYLGPPGTYTESAALTWAGHLHQSTNQSFELHPYPSISQTLQAIAEGQVSQGIVPVENSIEGSVTVTLDTLWQLSSLQIQQALVLPISHALISRASSVQEIRVVYSHPQALAQCQEWLTKFLPTVELVATNSTADAVQHLAEAAAVGAIASQRAAHLYHVPVLVHPINDYPDNCTRFWVLGAEHNTAGSHTSLAFSFPENLPGALARALQILAQRNINLSRIESRPTKRSLGDYLFFIDIEANINDERVKSALAELRSCTETLKIFGSYSIKQVSEPVS
jgi:prephenate dehydratase